MISYKERKLHSALLGAFFFEKNGENKLLKASVTFYLTAQGDEQQYGPTVSVDVNIPYTGSETVSELQETVINSAYEIIKKTSTFSYDELKDTVNNEETTLLMNS